MSRMFGDRINEFVLSVDIMSEETFFDLLNLVSSYLEQQLGVAYFAVLEEGRVDSRPGVTTRWSSADHRPAFSVDREAGYTSCSAFTFGENEPIWLVSPERKSLRQGSAVQNLWSDRQDMPGYRPSSDHVVHTSVMHPMRRQGEAIGIIEFACSDHIEPTPASLDEVGRLADTIARAYRMFDITESQKENTDRALRLLEASLTAESWTRLALPQMFVAFPGGSHLEGVAAENHERVIESIRRVVKRYSDKLNAIFWDDIDEAGNITEQVIENITSSEFGLCYFSEHQSSNDTYADNANVLFEAGMMQALTSSPGALLRGWVPIREPNAEPLPFDVAAERILMVDRTESSALDEAAFENALRRRMNSMVGLPEVDAPVPADDRGNTAPRPAGAEAQPAPGLG